MLPQLLQPKESSYRPAASSSSGRCVSMFPPSSKTFIQPKLTVNQPNDVYEQEADTMADRVMSMTSPSIQAKPFAISSLQRKCAHCEAEEEMQRKETNGQEATADSSLESYVSGLDSGGQSLPDEVRSFYEPRFGYDFSHVKVHTDTVAAKSAQSVNALAYTNGSNIVFNEGQYAPGTDSGKRLLAHELTHVVQQGNNKISKSPLQSGFTATASNQLSRQEGEAEPMSTSRSLRECINAGLSAAGLEIMVDTILMGACGIVATLAGIGTVEAGAIPGALLAAIGCLAFALGVDVGLLSGIVVSCWNNRNAY